MPSSLLFATNSEGRVYTLSTSSSGWREFPYLGLEFKKISAVTNFMWAIGGDRQVYVHVHGLDVPIRVKEESYENERWLPIEGFSKKLLPTDRYHYSSMDGTIDRNIDKIRLPSMAWQWEGDWHLDCTLDGQPLDTDGWMYALDFPATYQTKNAWNCYVRRRKWVRFRRYSALNNWCAVAPLHKDPTQEPFIDVAIGGMNIPNAPPGTMLVWAVTAHGRAMFRSGVSTTSPEGLRWTAISTPIGCEIAQISVGPFGLVWGVLYNGRAIVRSGVRRECLSGESWLEVKPPGSGIKIMQVSVGTDAVWCVTNDNHVWFRRGVKGAAAGISEDAAIGSGWVEMVGSISMVAVAANDQVFAIGSEDRRLYFRSGVSASDLTGKKWRLLQCPMQVSRTSSTMSLMSRKSGGSSPGSKHRSICSLYKDKERAVVETCAIIENVGPVESVKDPLRHKPELWKTNSASPPSVGSLKDHRRKHVSILQENSQASSAPAADIAEIAGKHFETQLKNPRAWSPVRSVGSIVGTEAHPESDSAVFDADCTRDSGVFGEDDDHGGSQYWAEFEVMWNCMTAGAVVVDPLNLPNWFNDTTLLDNNEELTREWRLDIIKKLKVCESALKSLKYSKYEKAVEMSSWTKSGEARVQKPGGLFEDCHIELEWVSTSSQDTASGSGTFTVLNPDGVTTKIQFSLSEITCIQCCSEPGSPRISIHAPRLPIGCSPIKLMFAGDTEMEDWISHLTSVCCQINEVLGKPANNSIWATTDMGDVFVFDPSNLKTVQFNNDTKAYTENVDVSATETPYYNTLYNGMSPGTELTVNGWVYDDADQIRFDFQCHPFIKVRHKVEKLRVIAMHLNPRFNEKVIVLNSMENSEWNNEVRNTNMVFAPGATFSLNIRSSSSGYRITVNGDFFTEFSHCTDPDAVTCLYVSGRVKLFNIIYQSPSVIIPLRDIFWRQIGGHIKKIFACSEGVVWGISCDSTPWVYNGGWGGTFLKGLESSCGKINTMTDSHNFYVYENQRWNPLSGYTTKGLPTDRHMWSDSTGKHKRSKEHTKLLSMHCEWISDWMVDFNAPGGVDKDGWQYAVDFPASYHGAKKITDCVRRRRWLRKCRLVTSGPWQELGNSKIIDASILHLNDSTESSIALWAIAINGDVLVRNGVSQMNPKGESWQHIPCEQPLISISLGTNRKVWVVGKNGTIYFRYGTSSQNVLGDAWQPIETPPGVTFKVVSAGEQGVWALDSTNRLAVRKEICATFPEGSHWQFLPNIPNIPPHGDTNVGFKSISVGKEVWATALNGIVCKRCSITNENPAGTGWHIGIPGQWQHISVDGYN